MMSRTTALLALPAHRFVGISAGRRCRKCVSFLTFWLLICGLVIISPQKVFAAKATVKTVPWVATNLLIPHDTYSGRQITLKGTSDMQGNNFKWTWDFGDGSPVATGTVTNKYVIETTHAYTGTPGQIFTARLSVQDTSNGDTGTNTYYVEVRALALAVEVNVAIDEGLWYLHKTQNRTLSGIVPTGDWLSGGFSASGAYGITAANVNAFEVNGHLESGNANDPYTETVQRGLRSLFGWLTTSAISPQTNGLGTFAPDTNGNGYAAYVNQGSSFYQGGMFIDAVIASGTPNAMAVTGNPSSGANPGIIGRTYRDIVADMVDGYLFCQHTGGAGGGWRYNCGDAPDNSACQWAAIGLIPAEREFGITIPPIVKNWNKVWLTASQDSTSGAFGYTQAGYYPWGPYADTASGMVQMAMDGIGRGNPMWDKAETFMRNNFTNSPAGGPTSAPRAYYYGLFSLVKSLLLHDPVGNGLAQPITLLRSSTPATPAMDWFGAQASLGDPSDGVARTLLTDQSVSGYWTGHDFSPDQSPLETAFAIMMLNETIVNPGAPVAVALATPNPVAAGGTVSFDGSASFHQDPLRKIVQWQWDFKGGTTFTATGPQVQSAFPGPLGSYPVRLRVTDDSAPPRTADTIVNVLVANPPIAPTANAGGPYSFCPQTTPWFLDGTKSSNPDDGQHDPGAPGDLIISYQWDLNGKNTFSDLAGSTPNVTTVFSSRVGTSFNISLKVTDNTAASFPTSGTPNLTNISSAQVIVHLATDSVCAQCVTSVTAVGGPGRVDLTWPGIGADHYNVYRSETSGGPYTKVGSAQLKNPPSVSYTDTVVTGSHTYYYVVRPAKLDGTETCQSNQVSATVGFSATQGCGVLSITNFQYQNKEAAAGVQSYVTYRADVFNPGIALGTVSAQAATLDPFTVRLVPGKDTLNFAPVPANTQVTSSNTFTLLTDYSIPFDASKLVWVCKSTPAPPVAVAGPIQTVKNGSTVTLDGSGSTNPSGLGVLTFKWTFASRPPGSTNSRLAFADTPSPSFLADAIGTYVLTLTVDNGTDSATSTVTITVIP